MHSSICFFVWRPARVYEHDLCACMWHQSLHIHQWSEGSPAAWQIGNPDLCLCYPLICPPWWDIIPPPAPVTGGGYAGVVLQPLPQAGPARDWIRLDQTGLTLCLYVSGSRNAPQVSEGFISDFYFSTSKCNKILQRLIWCPNIFKHPCLKVFKYI